jgi:hypothetical protein
MAIPVRPPSKSCRPKRFVRITNAGLQEKAASHDVAREVPPLLRAEDRRWNHLYHISRLFWGFHHPMAIEREAEAGIDCFEGGARAQGD